MTSLDDLVAEPWQRCAGCGHDERHHPLPLGIARTPCSWRGCGCPWFVFPTAREMAADPHECDDRQLLYWLANEHPLLFRRLQAMGDRTPWGQRTPPNEPQETP